MTRTDNEHLWQTAYRFINKQGRPSTVVRPDTGDGCVFVGPNGLGCAFAPALTAEAKRHPELIEDHGASEFYLKEELKHFVKPSFRNVDPDFADEVQRAHDDAANATGTPEEFLIMFRYNMRCLVEEYSLNIKY